MASPNALDVNDFTACERNSARKDLLKKIEHYNKKIRKTKESSFPLSTPAEDLIYKGVMKITYDRGYAIQTKSLLVGNNTSSEELIDQLIGSLGLTGCVGDYVLQEKNHLTHEIRTLKKKECPLNLLLQYGSHSSLLEIHLKSVNDSKFGEYTSMRKENYFDEKLLPVSDSIIAPKDEDHGTANVELIINEAFQDLPALVFDVQERLRRLSETVANGGKPRSNLLPRHYLWDTLKPQISSLVKDIRNLVDNGEFLVTKHCPSEEFRLVVTLLLELITDYSRELITVTKELCGLSRARKTDFDMSLDNFTQLIRYISDLSGKTYDCLYAVAVSGHLLHATDPENFVKGPFNEESVFTGSGAVSGVLIFTVITSYLGLVRAAYENKTDHFAALANNMLTSTNKALEKIKATNKYAVIHLHPLTSRVTDIEYKLQVSIDTLVNRVKVAALADPPLVSFLEMLLAGHQLVAALLDFLIVAQCASLLHKIVISGREVLQMPWVRGWAYVKVTNRIDSGIQRTTSLSSSCLTDQLSSSSDSVTEKSSGTASSRPRHGRERKSRITSPQRERDKGIGTEEYTEEVGYATVSVGLLSHPNHLPLGYLGETGEDAHNKSGRSQLCSHQMSVQRKCFEDKLLGQIPSSVLSPSKQQPRHLFCIDSSKCIDVAAVQYLRHHHLLNKTITRVAEGLLLTVTQSVNLLCQQCQENNRKMYCSTVKTLLVTAKHLQEEVLIMECDLVERKNMQDILSNYREKVDLVIRDIYMSLVSASTVHACNKDRMRLMAAATNLNELCSKIVGDALALVVDHSKALVHAEKLQQEFVALMTGQTLHKEQRVTAPPESGIVDRHKRRGIKLPSDDDAESVIFEEKPHKVFSLEITPKIIGGTLEQFLQRLTYHHVVDSEFVNTFILVFHSYLTPEVLLNALIEKYYSMQEGFEIETIIPVRLRVVHAIQLWLQYHPQDFNNSTVKDQLEKFLNEIESDMTKCSQQLLGLLKGDNPHQLLIVPRQSSQPILPTTDKMSFVLVDCNSLELARQLCIIYSNLLKEVHLKELLTSWKGGGEKNIEKKEGMISGLQTAKTFSKNFSNLISRILLAEKNEDDMSLIISYFIKTAESCHSLKNYEAMHAILDGLTAEYLRGSTQGAWQGLHESQLQMFKSLQNLVSMEENYHHYYKEFKDIYFTPCVPLLGAMLQDISSICHDMSDTLPGRHDVVNFTKWRKLADVLMRFYVIQSMPYGFTPVEVVQEYLQRLKQSL